MLLSCYQSFAWSLVQDITIAIYIAMSVKYAMVRAHEMEQLCLNCFI